MNCIIALDNKEEGGEMKQARNYGGGGDKIRALLYKGGEKLTF